MSNTDFIDTSFDSDAEIIARFNATLAVMHDRAAPRDVKQFARAQSIDLLVNMFSRKTISVEEFSLLVEAQRAAMKDI